MWRATISLPPSLTLTCQVRPRQGRYQSVVIMETFAVHFSTFGIATDPFMIEESEWPIGALALAITAVRTYNLVNINLHGP